MIIELENGERFKLPDACHLGILQGYLHLWVPEHGYYPDDPHFEFVELTPVNDKARELHKKYYDAVLICRSALQHSIQGVRTELVSGAGCGRSTGGEGMKKRYCNRCGRSVVEEKRLDYPYYCPHCDENMYEIETHEKPHKEVKE